MYGMSREDFDKVNVYLDEMEVIKARMRTADTNDEFVMLSKRLATLKAHVAKITEWQQRSFMYESGTRKAEAMKAAGVKRSSLVFYDNPTVTVYPDGVNPVVRPKPVSDWTLKEAANVYVRSGSDSDYARMISLVTLDTPESEFPKLVTEPVFDPAKVKREVKYLGLIAALYVVATVALIIIIHAFI